MKKALVVIVAIGVILLLATRINKSEGSCPQGSGKGTCPDSGKKPVSKEAEQAYQKSMTEARTLASQSKDKEAEEAVNRALKQKPDDPSAMGLKARLTHNIKGFTYSRTNEQGYQEYQHKKTGMIFVLIPGGVLKVESEGDGGGADFRNLDVKDFLMSKYETQQEVWQKIMKDNPSSFKKGEEYPVEQVAWEDCEEFCKRADLRLPADVEWEYACRAGTSTRYFWGKEPDGEYMWYDKNSGNSTHQIKEKKPNGYGLHNTLGNVYEWTADLYKAKTKSDRADAGAKEKFGVLRGGAYDQPAENCRCASYIRVEPAAKSKNAGVRFACTIK